MVWFSGIFVGDLVTLIISFPFSGLVCGIFVGDLVTLIISFPFSGLVWWDLCGRSCYSYNIIPIQWSGLLGSLWEILLLL